MRRLRPALALGLSLSLVAGCGLVKKKKPVVDDEPPPSAPAVAVGATGAKNEKAVLRYANETPAFDEVAVIGKDGVKAKTFPATGADVASLPRGTTVVKKAKFFSTGVLVLFDDPATSNGTKLLGWIAPEALVAGPVATAPVLTASKLPAPVGAKDAGLGVDAGASVDAGKPVVDAGGGSAPPALLQVNPSAGTCPAGFALVGPFCRRPCTTDRECPVSSFCTLSVGSRKTCAATR